MVLERFRLDNKVALISRIARNRKAIALASLKPVRIPLSPAEREELDMTANEICQLGHRCCPLRR